MNSRESRIAVFFACLQVVAAVFSGSVKSNSSTDICLDDQFRCIDGKCIFGKWRCNGRADCDDGSDEDTNSCNAAPTTTLDVGYEVTLHVHWKPVHRDIEIQLCSNSSCSAIYVAGETTDLALGHLAYTECNAFGDFCNETHRSAFPEKWAWFSEGEHVFEVQHRPSELAVWLKRNGRETAATVPVAEPSSRLRVVPYQWSRDMPVEFTGKAVACGGSSYVRCDSGMCISATNRCDGRKNCDDNSDEDPAICDAIPLVVLPVGNVVTARVQWKPRHRDVEIHLCNYSNCSAILVAGTAADMSLSYLAYTDNNARGGYGKKHHEAYTNNLQAWKWWSEGELVFEIMHHPSSLVVWLRGYPDKVATVPVVEPSDRLRIVPHVRSTEMPVTYSGNERACKDTEFRCSDGKCVDPSRRCDGKGHCDDGSDEEPALCAKAPTTTLPVGYVKTAKVHWKAEHRDIEIQLCSNTTCSAIYVAGTTPDMTLGHAAFSKCNPRGDFCNTTHRSDYPTGWKWFSEGDDLEFWVAHRPSELVVGLQSQSNKGVTVPVEEPSDLLRIVPYKWRTDMPVDYSLSCGKAATGPAELVLNGNKEGIESVPWHAAVFRKVDGKYRNVCGGSLVSPCFVVTAAHCLEEEEATVYVALGKYLSGWDSSGEKQVLKTKAKKVTRHPFYKGFVSKLVYDIAILELELCAELKDNIFPICLDDSIQPQSQTDIKVAGWGNETTVLTELESVKLNQLDFEDCLKKMETNGPQVGYITHDKFCAERHKATPRSGLLQGDSGGGALVKRNGKWYLAGVTSARLRTVEGEDVYALTNVSKYVDWIRRIAKL